MTHFTSDTHFGHANIISLCKRPYVNVDEMNAALVDNWNSVVAPGDTVYHLGDFAFRAGPAKTKEILSQLNGQIKLIEGNHEEDLFEVYVAHGAPNVELRPPLEEIKIGKQSIVMCHYGMRTWNHDLRGVWHLYGHSHGGLPPMGKSVDVGVDSPDFPGYRPISFDELKAFMDTRSVHKALEVSVDEAIKDAWAQAMPVLTRFIKEHTEAK